MASNGMRISVEAMNALATFGKAFGASKESGQFVQVSQWHELETSNRAIPKFGSQQAAASQFSEAELLGIKFNAKTAAVLLDRVKRLLQALSGASAVAEGIWKGYRRMQTDAAAGARDVAAAVGSITSRIDSFIGPQAQGRQQ